LGVSPTSRLPWVPRVGGMDVRPLRELLAELVGDAEARAAYGADPAGYLAAHGHDLPGELVASAVVSYADTAPLEVAAALAPFVAAHGAVPDGADPSWFDLLTSAEVGDDSFDLPLDGSAGESASVELDFGAGADPEPVVEASPVVVDDVDVVEEPASSEELPVEEVESSFVPEPPIDGLELDDDSFD
jgi:hypothetical protein